MKTKHEISASKQNIMINAIKFYFEKVLGKDLMHYDIKRPKKGKSLPEVMTMEECHRLVSSPRNIKQRAMLTLIYSSGLRIG